MWRHNDAVAARGLDNKGQGRFLKRQFATMSKALMERHGGIRTFRNLQVAGGIL